MPTIVEESNSQNGVINEMIPNRTVMLPEPIPESNENLDQTGTINALNAVLADVKTSIETAKGGVVTGDKSTYDDEILLLDRTAEIAALNTTITQKTTEITTLTDTVATKTAEANTLRDSLTTKAAEVDTLTATLATKDDEIATINASLAAKIVEVDDLTAQLAAKVSEIDTLNATIATKTNEIETLTSRVAAQTNEIATLNDKVTEKDGKIATLTTEVSTLSDTITTKTNEITALNDSVATKDGEITTLTNEVATQKSEITTLTDNVAAKTNEITTLNESITAKEGEITTLTSEVATLNDTIATKTNEITTLTDQLAAKANEVIALSSTMADIKAAIEAKKGSSVDGDSSTYDDEITSLPSGSSFDPMSKEWYDSQRDSKWLPIEHLVTDADDQSGGKAVMLFQVPRNGLYVRIRLSELPDIDWGDGHAKAGGTGSSYSYHTIMFDDLPASTELDNGCRQAIVTISAHDGRNIKYVNPFNDGQRYGGSPVEMIIISSELNSMNLKYYKRLELLIIKGSNKITQPRTLPSTLKYLEYDLGKNPKADKLCVGMANDPKFTLDITNITSLDSLCELSVSNLNMNVVGIPQQEWTGVYMYGRMMAGEIKEIDYSKCKSFYKFAYGAVGINSTPLIDMGGSTNNKKCFDQAYELLSVNIINCKSSISFYLCHKFSLRELLDFGLNSIVDMTGGAEQSVDVRNTGAKEEINDLGDSGVITHKGVSYTKSGVNTLFNDKNWKIVV